eukprot:9038252-Pyramimonas_sp.AAC.1
MQVASSSGLCTTKPAGRLCTTEPAGRRRGRIAVSRCPSTACARLPVRRGPGRCQGQCCADLSRARA